MTNSDQPIEPAGVIEIEMDLMIRAGREHVWKTLIEEIAAWWPKDFYCLGQPARMLLEPRLGGRLYEDIGNGAGLLWATVLLYDPPNRIVFAGHLLPPWGGPATTLWRVSLESAGNTTRLRLSDHVYGRVSEPLRTNLEMGWRLLFEQGLKSYVEQ